MGATMSAEWWREYRRKNKERLNGQQRVCRSTRRTRNRVKEYEDRNLKRQAIRALTKYEPLPLLYPHLQNGISISFWKDELKLDLAQEKVLAELEGRNSDEAVKAYKSREMKLFLLQTPYTGIYSNESVEEKIYEYN